MVSVRSLNKRSTTILIAAVLALGTGLLAFNYLSSMNKIAQNVPMRLVLVATHDIPVRSIVTPEMVTTAERPADSVEPDALADANAASGQIALITIPSGALVSASKIGRIDLGGLTVRIPRGERAISIALDRVKGVADLIAAGDHVDVIAVTESRGGNGGSPHAATILRNKTVLAMGSTLEVPAASGASPAPETAIETATLAVTPAEAQTLVLADINATLRLALRSNKDQRGTEAGDPFLMPTADSAHPGPLGGAAPSVKQPVRAPKPHRIGPPIIDGDRLIN